jgi:GTP-binding protein
VAHASDGLAGPQQRCDGLQVNPTRCKKLTNVRSKQADEKFVIQPPRLLTLEDCIGYVQPDELIEVTPDAIRLRKMALNAQERKKAHSRLQMSPAIQIQAVPAMAA